MAGVSVISFDEALDRTISRKRDLLLGNGFSIAADDRFRYDGIFRHAAIDPEVATIFATKRTTNFEEVMRVLLAEMQGATSVQAERLQTLVQGLKEALIASIHRIHPKRRWEIGAAKIARCEEFLQHFIGRKRTGRIFTTNYDLLLTWVTSPDGERRKPDKLFRSFDGFEAGYYKGLGAATIIYLHGALHLAGRGQSVRKLTYLDTGIALHDQVAARLERREFPLIVTEGASSLKMPREPGLLRDALTAFRGTCRQDERTALFTLGHGLGPEDSHILKNIPAERIPAVYLGAFRQEEIKAFETIADVWIAERARNQKPPLEVFIFNGEGVAWGAEI